MLKTLFTLLALIPLYVTAEYKNTNGKAIDKSIKDLIRWQRNQKKPVLASIEISDEWQSIDVEEADNYMIWIGHSTFLIKKNSLTILTDPVFSDRASPFKRFGPKRLIPPSITIEELPPIDVVTISHNHYDHLDIRSLKKLIDSNYPNPYTTQKIPETIIQDINEKLFHIKKNKSYQSVEDIIIRDRKGQIKQNIVDLFSDIESILKYVVLLDVGGRNVLSSILINAGTRILPKVITKVKIPYQNRVVARFLSSCSIICTYLFLSTSLLKSDKSMVLITSLVKRL